LGGKVGEVKVEELRWGKSGWGVGLGLVHIENKAEGVVVVDETGHGSGQGFWVKALGNPGDPGLVPVRFSSEL
jgi:hypothetical protein